MYQEYAIDPTTICRSFDRFKLVWNGLGYPEGRLLSRFPGRWEDKVFKSASYEELPDGLRKKWIFDALAAEAKTRQKLKSIASGRDFDSNATTWLEEAERAHSAKPFSGILSETNPRGNADIVCYDELGDVEDCWNVPRPWQVTRFYKDMSAAAAPLLHASREILFVEPYFKFESRFTRPLKAFLSELVPYASPIRRIEIHLKQWDGDVHAEDFQEEFSQALEANLRHLKPDDGDAIIEKLEFFIWESPTGSNAMHPRYILTEVAGLGFENGLDESSDGCGLTDVSIIAGDSLTNRWKEFQESTCTRRQVAKISARELLT
jgi:hypothetical protein